MNKKVEKDRFKKNAKVGKYLVEWIDKTIDNNVALHHFDFVDLKELHDRKGVSILKIEDISIGDHRPIDVTKRTLRKLKEDV